MKLACTLFQKESKAREICEEILWEIAKNGEFVANTTVLKTTLIGYVLKRLEKEGIITVYRRRGEKIVRVTLSNETKQDIERICKTITKQR